jgi:hypothetical protein
MNFKILTFALLLFFNLSCDVVLNPFSEQKFKGTYKIEIKELLASEKDPEAGNAFFAALAKIAMSDMEMEITFGDNKKGSLKLDGTAVALFELLSDEMTKPKDFSYYVKSDSILMIDFGIEGKTDYKKFGTVRSYKHDYSKIVLYVSDEKNSKMGSLVTMKRIQ